MNGVVSGPLRHEALRRGSYTALRMRRGTRNTDAMHAGRKMIF